MSNKRKDQLEADIDQLVILAIRAGYKSNMPFGGDHTVSPEMRMNLLKYAVAIQTELSHHPIEHIMLERFVELAVKFTGHKEITASSDMNDMLKASAMETFYTRFAYQVAQNTKETK